MSKKKDSKAVVAESPVERLEETLSRLDEIVRRLERGDLELEEAIALYREGASCVLSANQVRKRVELEVLQVIEQVNGELGLSPLESAGA